MTTAYDIAMETWIDNTESATSKNELLTALADFLNVLVTEKPTYKDIVDSAEAREEVEYIAWCSDSISDNKDAILLMAFLEVTYPAYDDIIYIYNQNGIFLVDMIEKCIESGMVRNYTDFINTIK